MTTLTLTPTWFGGLFCYGFGEVPVAEIGPGALKVNYKGINERIAYSQVINVEIENGLFWSTLVQRPANGLDNLYQEWFADIRPAKRLGQGLVKEGDERQNPAFEFFG